jgi:1-acyl-sn-glycerol-3-phosphate acyltransferase
MSLGESASYRSLIVASQYATWLFSQLLRLRYSIRAHYPALFERDTGHCLILAANHQTYVDLGLIIVAVGYRRFRGLVPIRILGALDFRSRFCTNA